MNFLEYKRASTRHLHTCEHLLSSLPTFPQEKQKQILLNVYYLSGYIVETALSYAFFSHKKYKGNVEDCTEYKEGFKTHKFDVKVYYINKSNGDLSGIPFINTREKDNKLNQLYNYWSTDFRYSHNEKIKSNDLNEEIIKQYLAKINMMLTIILKRF